MVVKPTMYSYWRLRVILIELLASAAPPSDNLQDGTSPTPPGMVMW